MNMLNIGQAAKLCAIMQPTYLPWTGYFNLIASVDHFVYLDDVQFSKNSWHSRNRILVHGLPNLISLSIPSHGIRFLNEVVPVNLPFWMNKHIKTLQSAYGRAPHFEALESVFSYLQGVTADASLADLNCGLIDCLCRGLGIDTPRERASKLNIHGQRSERLLKICQHFRCGTYLSPQGARDYLFEDGDFERSPVKLLFQQYTPRPYSQIRSEDFISHLSVIDAIAHLGWAQTRALIGPPLSQDWRRQENAHAG